MTESFDAVLRDARNTAASYVDGLPYAGEACREVLSIHLDRLAAAHAAEVGELRQWRFDVCERLGMSCAVGAEWTPAEVFGLVMHEEGKVVERAKKAETRAEAAERDARRFAWWFERGQVSSDALVELNLRVVNGDYPTLAEWRTAIDAAIATAEAAHEA